MKKGVVIGLVALVAIVGFLATHRPARHAPGEGTETAAQLAAPTSAEPAAGGTPATEQPKPAPATPAAPTAAPATPAAATPAATPVTTPAAAPPAEATAKPGEVDLGYAMAERSLGDVNAPVTVIEYASLTCPHCAHFATDILPVIKTKLIDTGKMRLIFRDFPLDAMAMKAAEMARCAPKEKYFDLIEVIFKNRDRWLPSASPEAALMQFGALAGMDDALMKRCMSSAELENAITTGLQEAQGKFYIKATPSFIFDYGTETLTGAQEEPKFEEVVNRLTAAKK